MTELKVEEEGMRLDAYVAATVEALSRSEAVRLIEEGHITVNGKTVHKKYPVRCNDRILIELPDAEPYEAQAEDIPLDIVYQDADIAVINKPQGMVVHPAHGNYSGTLVHALLYHIHDLSGINGVMRPGIVHRLDKNTSGLIVVAKNDFAHNALARQFKQRDCEKIYLALAEGVFAQQDFTVENYIGRSKKDRKKMCVYNTEHDGKFSSTEFHVQEQYRDTALVACRLNTGRTHQIRVHLASVGHPCLGDAEYGFKKNRFGLQGQALHAYSLKIKHPRTDQWMHFTAPVPEYFSDLISKLQKS